MTGSDLSVSASCHPRPPHFRATVDKNIRHIVIGLTETEKHSSAEKGRMDWRGTPLDVPTVNVRFEDRKAIKGGTPQVRSRIFCWKSTMRVLALLLPVFSRTVQDVRSSSQSLPPGFVLMIISPTQIKTEKKKLAWCNSWSLSIYTTIIYMWQ